MIDRTTAAGFDALLSQSRLVGGVRRGIDLAARAFEASRISGASMRAVAAWSAAGWAVQRRFAGTLLLVASATHAALQAWQQAPAGWLWLILPGLAAAAGLLLALASVEGAAGSGRPTS